MAGRDCHGNGSIGLLQAQFLGCQQVPLRRLIFGLSPRVFIAVSRTRREEEDKERDPHWKGHLD